MNDDSHYIKLNKHIDTLPMVMNWEIDTFVIAILSIGISIILNGMFVYFSLIFGCIFLIINEKLKNTKYKNYLVHILYMLGLKKIKSNRLPNSELRVFIG